MIRALLIALLTLTVFAPEAAAVYDPGTGRFINRDPAGYIDGMNLYRYGRSNPLRYTDPMGLSPESDAWNDSGYQKHVNENLDFWLDWLGSKEIHDGERGPVSPECKEKLKCIIRAISWVESRHGTGAGNHPGRDPMQVGHPDDEAHKSITDQNDQRGPIREGPLPGVPNYDDLPGRINQPYPPGGHRDPEFGPDDSFRWGIPWYFMRSNQSDKSPRPKSAWNLGDCSWDRLIDGAERYNGGGDPGYRDKVKDALKQSGCKDDDC